MQKKLIRNSDVTISQLVNLISFRASRIFPLIINQINFNIVVFPEPDGPTSAVIVLGFKIRLVFFKTSFLS